MRQPPRVGQIVFRDDDARGSARGARKRFQLIFPFARRAQIDRAQIFCEFGVRLHGNFVRQQDRMIQDSLLGITSHPRKSGEPSLSIVRALDNRREGVASGATKQLVLLRLCARDAEQPLGTRELRNQVLGLHQLQICAARYPSRDFDGHRASKVIPHGSDINVEFAGQEPVRRKRVAPLVIRDHGDADRLPFSLSSDQHTFHRPFGVRTHPACKRHRRGFLSGRSGRESQSNDCKQSEFHPHR